MLTANGQSDHLLIFAKVSVGLVAKQELESLPYTLLS